MIMISSGIGFPKPALIRNTNQPASSRKKLLSGTGSLLRTNAGRGAAADGHYEAAAELGKEGCWAGREGAGSLARPAPCDTLSAGREPCRHEPRHHRLLPRQLRPGPGAGAAPPPPRKGRVAGPGPGRRGG